MIFNPRPEVFSHHFVRKESRGAISITRVLSNDFNGIRWAGEPDTGAHA